MTDEECKQNFKEGMTLAQRQNVDMQYQALNSLILVLNRYVEDGDKDGIFRVIVKMVTAGVPLLSNHRDAIDNANLSISEEKSVFRKIEQHQKQQQQTHRFSTGYPVTIEPVTPGIKIYYWV